MTAIDLSAATPALHDVVLLRDMPRPARAFPPVPSPQSSPNVTARSQWGRTSERRQLPRRAEDYRQRALAECTTWWIDREPRPMIIVDARLHVLLMNAPAARFLAVTRTIRLHASRLVFSQEGHRSEVERLLQRNLGQVSFKAQVRGSAMTISVQRMPSVHSVAQPLLISAVSGGVDGDCLRTKFGLTQAETEIALAIFNGKSLVLVARSRDVSINTVKTQVRHIFQKCRVQSQNELTRRLSELLHAASFYSGDSPAQSA